MHFVANETGLKLGPLTVISTHAEIDQPRRNGKAVSRADITSMIAEFDQATTFLAV